MGLKAVILAAGKGVRIQGIAGNTPKSLLEIGKDPFYPEKQTTFLERQIACLKKAGVNKIAVVVGYEKEKIRQRLAQTDVTIIENLAPDISASGSLHSFQFAVNSEFEPLDGESNTLLLDADIVYEQRVINYYTKQLKQTSTLISPNISHDSEEVKVYGEKLPFFIGKGLTPLLVNNMKCIGEATGIVHFAPKDHTLVIEVVNWLLGDPKAPKNSMKYKGFGPAKIKTEHEELSQRLMLLGKMECTLLPKEYLFMEVDFDTEYHYMRENFYPKVTQADRHLGRK